MQSARNDDWDILEINASQHIVYSVLFAECGRVVLGGGEGKMLQRWRVDSGHWHQVGEPIRVERGEVLAAALSPDAKWLVCGLYYPQGNAGRAGYIQVWDARTNEKVLDIHGHVERVISVDVSSDSQRVVSGSLDKQAFVWSITTGQKLVGPLQHDGVAVGVVRFSPNGDRIATVTVPSGSQVKPISIFNSQNGEKLLDIPLKLDGSYYISTLLAWSADGRRLYAASCGRATCFDASLGSLLSQWSIPAGSPTCITLAHEERFISVSTRDSLSFWDTSSHQQIGTTIEYASKIWGLALSQNDDCVATCEQNGTITLRNLRSILPDRYFKVIIPLMQISNTTLESWKRGDLIRVEQLLTEEVTRLSNPFEHAHMLAHRAVIRARSKQYNTAIEDAKKSLDIQRSALGHIANALSRICNEEHELAIRQLDIMFRDSSPDENDFLLLVKAIILFECARYDEAVSRVQDLIDVVDDKSLYITVRARMFLSLGSMRIRNGDYKCAVDLFERAQEAIPFQQSSHLITISLLFGWDFERLPFAIRVLELCKTSDVMDSDQLLNSFSMIAASLSVDILTSEGTTDWGPELVERCAMAFEQSGDTLRPVNPKEAIEQYSVALSLSPSSPTTLFVKRSRAKADLGLWEAALGDSDEAIKADATNPWGYERRRAALFALGRFDEVVDMFNKMFSLAEESPNEETRELLKKYLSPAKSQATVDGIIKGVLKACPLVLIDVKSGRLCDVSQRKNMFKTEPQFIELISSITEVDHGQIQRVAEKYFEYVTFSHVWEGKEPSFQDVNAVNSVWNLGSSPLNDKLRRFCEVVRDDGYRWAWSDTCCIDKTISTVLNQSLTLMYKWYEASAATFVLLADVDSPSAPGALTDSVWMTRAWTEQELLAPKVIRFYDRSWKPYIGDMRSNHKESPEITRELANAIKISREAITSFHPDDLSVQVKLRLASTRNATVEEDVAYSLIGIFRSDIRPYYGEGDAALGHLLEEIVSRSGDVVVLSWTGKSSTYNSCLPANLLVYSRTPGTFSAVEDSELGSRVTALRDLFTLSVATSIYSRITRLPPARFANRRLYLPCIIFAVKRLSVQSSVQGSETHFRARVPGIGHVEFQTSEGLPMTEPRQLVFVHPWIRDLRDPVDGLDAPVNTSSEEDGEGSDSDSGPDSSPFSPLHPGPAVRMDDYTRALRLIVRLQQPFHALLLQQQPGGEFRRVVTESDIVVPGIERRRLNDIHTDVLEIL